jgi:hypothetical protein
MFYLLGGNKKKDSTERGRECEARSLLVSVFRAQIKRPDSLKSAPYIEK